MSKTRKKTNFALWLIILVCIAPVIASSIAYYLYRPEGRVNYGFLIDEPIDAKNISVSIEVKPQQESSFLGVVKSRSPKSEELIISSIGDFVGRWLLVRIGSSDCDEVCTEELYAMRQVRLMTGKNRSRVERIWLIPNHSSASKTSKQDEYDGTWGLSVSNSAGFLKRLDLVSKNFDENLTYKGLWLIDPQGFFMMRFPEDADIKKIYKDIARLLKVSRTG